MKNMILLFLLIPCTFVYSQEDLLGTKFNRCKVYVSGEKYPITGKLFLTGDSSITIIPDVNDDGKLMISDTVNKLVVPVSRIMTLKLHRRGGAGQGIVVGGSIGLFVGGILGYADGDDPPGWFSMTAGEKAATGAVLGFIPGALIGLAASPDYDKFYMNGRLDYYINTRKAIDAHSIRRNKVSDAKSTGY